MGLRFFQIPARGCAIAESELNSFLSSHRVLTIDRRWVDLGENSYWAICVDFQPTGSSSAGAANASGSRPRIDYREVLPPDQFEIFSELRTLRKEISESEGVPVYAVFSNKQLADSFHSCECS